MSAANSRATTVLVPTLVQIKHGYPHDFMGNREKFNEHRVVLIPQVVAVTQPPKPTRAAPLPPIQQVQPQLQIQAQQKPAPKAPDLNTRPTAGCRPQPPKDWKKTLAAIVSSLPFPNLKHISVGPMPVVSPKPASGTNSNSPSIADLD